MSPRMDGAVGWEGGSASKCVAVNGDDKENVPCGGNATPSTLPPSTGKLASANRSRGKARRGAPLRSLKPGDLTPKALSYGGSGGNRARAVPGGLQAGDVVCLSIGGKVLRARPSTSSEVLEFEAPDVSADRQIMMAEPMSQLIVQRSSEWVGFKLSTCSKMLQAKRKGRSRYGFFSTKFGVAEQWTIDPEPPQGWEAVQVVLRNRRLEAIEIDCELLRVPAEMTRRAADTRLPSPWRSIASCELSAMSQASGLLCKSLPSSMSHIMLSQWENFVSKEVATRRDIEEQLKALQHDMDAVREESVIALRQMHDEAKASGIEIVELAKEQAKSHFARRCGYWKMRYAFTNWREQAVRAATQRISFVRRLLQRSFRAWHAESVVTLDVAHLFSHTSQATVPLCVDNSGSNVDLAIGYVRAQRSQSTCRRIMLAWLRLSLCAAAGRMMARQRGIQSQRNIISGWHLVVKQSRLHRVAVDLMQANICRRLSMQIFWNWRITAGEKAAQAHMVASRRSMRKHRYLERCFVGWRQELEQSHYMSLCLQEQIWKVSTAIMRSALEEWWVFTDFRAEQMRVKERFLQTRTSSRLLKETFESWADSTLACHYTLSGDDIMGKLAGWRRKRMLAAAFWQLKQAAADSIAHKGFLHKRLTSVRARWELDFMRTIITRWMEFAERRTALSILSKVGARRASRIFVAQTFHAWVASSADQQLQAQHAMRLSKLRGAFYSWQLVSSTQLSEPVKAGWMRLMATRTKRRFFFSWYAVVLSIQASGQAYRNSTILSAVLSRWRQLARKSSLVNQLRPVFNAWKSMLPEKLAIASSFYQKAALSRSLRSWIKQKGMTSKLSVFASIVNHHRVRGAFQRWHEFAVRSRAMMETFMTWTRRRARMAFNSWLQFIVWEDVRSIDLSRLSGRIANKMVRCVLYEWRKYTQWMSWSQLVLRNQRQKAAFRVLQGCLMAWRNISQKSVLTRNVLLWHVNKQSSATQLAVLKGWRGVLLSTSLKRKAADAQYRLQSLSILESWFAMWLQYTVSVGKQRQEARELAERLKAKSMFSSFEAWRSSSFLSRRARTMCLKAKLKALRSTFDHWRTALSSAIWARDMSFILLRRFERSKLLLAWSAWRCFAYNTGRQAEISLLTLAARMCERCLRRSMAAWVMAVDSLASSIAIAAQLGAARRELLRSRSFLIWRRFTIQNQERRQRVRLCITSKRVAQEWFVNWYASAFEEEIDSASRMLYKTCEDSISCIFREHSRLFKPNMPPPARQTKYDTGMANELLLTEPANCGVFIPHSLAADFRDSESLRGSFQSWSTPSPDPKSSSKGFGVEASPSDFAGAGMAPAYGNPLFAACPSDAVFEELSPVCVSPHPAYQPTSVKRGFGLLSRFGSTVQHSRRYNRSLGASTALSSDSPYSQLASCYNSFSDDGETI